MDDHFRLARIGYEAYGATTDHKNYQGLPMPTWEALPDAIKNAWRAASEAIVQSVALPHSG